MSLINGFYIEYSIFLTQDMSCVILCTWRCFLPKHSPPDHLQRNICPWTFKHSNKYILENHIWLPELLEQVEFELASICWLEQMSVKVEQVLFQKTRPCAMTSVMTANTEGTFFLDPPAEYRQCSAKIIDNIFLFQDKIYVQIKKNPPAEHRQICLEVRNRLVCCTFQI